jgi:hypothetical protein
MVGMEPAENAEIQPFAGGWGRPPGVLQLFSSEKLARKDRGRGELGANAGPVN